jgi:hypothetical protein
VVPRREDIIYDHIPNQGIQGLGFEWDSYVAAWNSRLGELADYHESQGTAMFLKTTATTQSWLIGQNPKEAIQFARKRKAIAYEALPYPGIGKAGC